MKIAFATPVVYPFVKGGVEKRIYEIGRRLANRGHEITVYSRHWWDGSGTRQYEQMTLKAIAPAKNIYTDGDRRSVSSAVDLAGHLVKLLLEPKYDIVCTPVAPYFHVFPTRLSTALKQASLVVTWHEVWDNYWYQYMGQTGVIGKGIEWITAQLPQHMVVPSRMTKNKLESLTSRQSIRLIPNGINFDTISSTTPVKNGYDILYAGRLIADKNVDLLIKALEQSGVDSSLGIIGDGPASTQLHNYAAQSDVAEQITFLGFLDDYDDVIAHMNAANLFVSPSTREGFGITLLEAMAADCTVIAAKHEHSAGSEVIGNAGFAVEPNVDELANMIKKATHGQQPPASPTDRAQQYDWEIVTDQTENFYRSLL